MKSIITIITTIAIVREFGRRGSSPAGSTLEIRRIAARLASSKPNEPSPFFTAYRARRPVAPSVSVVGKVLVVDASFPMSAPAPALSREGPGHDVAVDDDPDNISPALIRFVVGAPCFRLG